MAGAWKVQPTTQRFFEALRRFAERRPVLFVLLLYLLAKLSLLAVGRLVVHNPEDYLVRLSTAWDGAHYLQIAQNGYAFNQANLANPYAFAPVFPFLVQLTGAHELSPFIVANVISFGSVAVVAVLLGWRAGAFFALFPTWLAYSSVGYSESVYVLFAALAFVLFRRGLLEYAGVAAAFAVLSRYGGAPAFIAYAYGLARRPLRDWVRFGLPGALVLSVLLAFFWFVGGHVLVYFKSESLWGAELAWPWEQLDFYLHGWFTTQPSVIDAVPPAYWMTRAYAFAAVSIWGAWRLWQREGEPMLALFSAIAILLTLTVTGPPAISSIRLLLLGFPAIAILGRALHGAASWVAYSAFAFLGGVWVLTGHHFGFFA